MSRAIKFVLKMIVAAGIVVGIVFLVSYFVTPKSDATKISKTETELNLVQKIQNSYEGFNKSSSVVVKGIVDLMPEGTPPADQYPEFFKTKTLPASKDVSDIFVVYYQYYVSISNYATKEDVALQSKIIEQMQALNTQANKTIEYLDFIDKYKKAKNYTAEDTVFYARLDKWVASYQKQTEILMDLAENLRKYVYQTNYQTDLTEFRYTGETKLEIAKDYAKAVFVDALNKKLKTDKTLHLILQDASSTNFLKTYEKFVTKIENVRSPKFQNLFADSNEADELRLFYVYGKITSNNLHNSQFDINSSESENLVAGFYQLSTNYDLEKYHKDTYFCKNDASSAKKDSCLRNFIDEYYGEKVTAGTKEYYLAEYQHIALNALYNYLLGESL